MMNSQVLAETKGGSTITVWSTDRVCGLSFDNKHGSINISLEDDKVPYIDFFTKREDGSMVSSLPAAIYTDKDGHFVIQVGGKDGSVIDTNDLMCKVHPK